MFPDLAGKMSDSGKLGIESSLEHSAANLDKLTLEEKLKINQLNRKYKKKFGFPFIICARLNKKDAIIDGLNTRLNNDHEQELQNGIKEVLKICELRIRDLVYDENIKTSISKL